METLTVTLTLARETKGTFFFEASDPSSHITSLYIKKAAFSGPPPKVLTLTVEDAGA